MINNISQNQSQDNKMILTENLSNQVEEIGFQIDEEIDRLVEMIIDNPHIPFLGKTLVDENLLINQIELIKINIPDTLEQALEILQQKERIISESQQYAQKLIDNAQKKANQILDETRIVQQAEAQANQIRKQVQQECENLQKKTLAEVEQIKKKTQQEINKMKQEALLEYEEIQNDADDYTDSSLSRLEKQLAEMLKIVHNGRRQLNHNSNNNIPPMDKKVS